MANVGDLEMKVIIGERPEMRPCWINDGEIKRKALFHCWEQKSQLLGASLMLGGHPGGVVSGMVALVEYEDGTMHEEYPRDVRFDDTEAVMSEYVWIHDRGEGEDGTV